MLELSPDAVGAGAVSSAIVVTICTIVGRYALPRWIAAREKHEEESDSAMGQLRERIDQASSDWSDQLNAHATRIHDRMDSVNVLVGTIKTQTDRNERDISGLANIVHGINGNVARLQGSMEGVTIAVQALTAAYTNGKNNGRA
jgi:methyl-accepting chemotaxis protein